jgi:uncharacterized protein
LKTTEEKDSITMDQQRFEWDDFKAEINFRKHGVTFEEAITVFGDVFYLEDYDEANSDQEDRFKAIGKSINDRLLIVVYTERNDRIRIISTRVASNYERRYYDAQF